MKNTIYIIFISCMAYSSMAQVNEVQVEPKGVYKEIDMESQLQMIQILSSQNSDSVNQGIKDITSTPNKYSPPVVFVLAHVLSQKNKMDEASYWYYFAQLRGRIDAKLCTDKTAGQAISVLVSQIGPPINEYSFSDIERLKGTFDDVIAFLRTNEADYDRRWIALHGMGAFTGGNEAIILPREEWNTVKKETIDTYYAQFIEHVYNQREKYEAVENEK